MSRRPRVLLLLHELSRTGAPNVALHIFESLASRVDLATFALLDGAQRARAERLGPVWVVNKPRERFVARQITRLRRNWHHLRARLWQPDLIYANSVLALPLLELLPGVPAILHVHEIRTTLARFIEPYRTTFLTRPSRYFAASEAVVDTLTRDYAISADKITLAQTFVSDGDFAGRSPERQRTPDMPLTIGGAGAPGWIKGPLLWLQTAEELVKIHGRERTRFVWIGMRDDEESDEFREMARRLRIDDVVQFVGETAAVLDHLQQIDILAMTSWEESASLVTLEAMMLGKPVVCFRDSIGPAALIGATGVALPNYSPRAMAESIAELAADPQRARQLGTAARERVEHKFLASVRLPDITSEILNIARSAQ